MNTPLKLAGFGICLVVVFAAATGLGAAVGPSSSSVPPAHTDDHDSPADTHGSADDSLAGLQVSEDGYTLALDRRSAPAAEGTDVTFRATELTFSVSRGGVPVTDLQPYLSSSGHLVVLRDRDLAYLHVHPGTEAGDAVAASGPHVRFVAETPSAGTYGLFLDFRHGDAVHTAAFTVAVPTPATVPTEEAGS